MRRIDGADGADESALGVRHGTEYWSTKRPGHPRASGPVRSGKTSLIRERLDLPGTVAAVRRLTTKWPQAGLKLVEDKANGPAVIQSLRREISGLVEVNPEGGKMSRAAAASPQLESGNWYVPHPMLRHYVDGFIAECAAFPSGANDDQVDAWSQGANRLLLIRPKPPRPIYRPVYRDLGPRSWMA